MSTYSYDNILCPFFKGEKDKWIMCEGLCGDNQYIVTRQEFRHPKRKEEWLNKRCSSGWCKCPWADCLNRKYGE